MRRPATPPTTRPDAAGRRSAIALGAIVVVSFLLAGFGGQEASGATDPALAMQGEVAARAKSEGCLSCHAGVEPMHASPAVTLGCTDCHGGNAGPSVAPGTPPDSEAYRTAKETAHVAPRFPEEWGSEGRSPSANPERTYTKLLRESWEFVRFMNPGDLRVAAETCGPCHARQVDAVRKSPMTTTAIFWAAAAYANGILPTKGALLGESYTPEGEAGSIRSVDALTPYELAKGARPMLLPLPRWEITQPGEYFRAFEEGGELTPSTFPEIGNPNPADLPGLPDIHFSNRGRGTGLRITPALINLHKTRLNDPHLSMMGTNDHPGDFRNSGCTACHVVYANDRDPSHSGPFAAFGNLGESATADPTIPRRESGHPIAHRLTRAIPTSQCMSCHMHQPNSFVNTYLGYMMWDYETDGEQLWPKEQKYPTHEEELESLAHNPEGAAVRGKWTDTEFLARVSELNPELEHTQFADYHGHGWIFRAVYDRDRKGNLLDENGEIVSFDDPERLQKAVHLQDIHLEAGMHCVDCHFSRDAHGDGTIHGEYGDAIEIACVDCHGTIDAVTPLRTSGPAAPPGGTDLSLGTTPFGQQRFAWREGKLYQRSMLREGLEWRVRQIRDSVDPASPDFNLKAAHAKTMLRDGSWGDPNVSASSLAHAPSNMTCDTCHSSWMTSCFGCHLPQRANMKSPMLRYEGKTTRNLASYNPQVLRSDVFMLGRDGTVKGNRIAPVRSSSALVLSSENINRQRVYVQQPPISAPGYASQAFNPHVPHTVRSAQGQSCTDCHLSADNDNNAWMAQLMLQGTGFVNLIGRNAWVGLGEDGLEAVPVTEWTEPQAVIGSTLHRMAYPDWFREHEERGRELEESHHHHGKGTIHDIQLRGEYLYTAAGKAGLRIYDVANVDNKDFSERIVTAPVSPLGQRTWVKTKNATALALPTNMPVAPWRRTALQYPENEDRPMHPIYRYAFVGDAEEGLILVNVDTLTDADPKNNFLERTPIYGQPAWDADGLLTGIRDVRIAGDLVYVLTDGGMVITDFGDFGPDPDNAPEPRPRVVSVLTDLDDPRAVDLQFRYAFVAESGGLAVVDVTDPGSPRRVAEAGPIADARNVYVARTYAYVAGGSEGVVIVDVERPDRPRIVERYTAGGQLDDVRDVKIGSTYATLYAYVADGHNGLRVLQLTSPDRTPGYLGFSPEPKPELIATRHTHGPATAISRGLDRDRAVDESGNQVAIFNRIGARPLNLEEMRALYLRDGEIYTVTDEPEDPPRSAEETGGDP